MNNHCSHCLPKLLSASVLLFCSASSGADIIVKRSPVIVTHTVTSNGSTLGISNLGGGYINHLTTGANQPNLIAQGFGRAGQTAIRDFLHKGRHNPTQGGAKDNFGSPCNVTAGTSTRGSGGKLTIGRFPVPLYLNPAMDFTQNEDIAPDAYSNDGGNTDNDKLGEAGQTQEDEITSEFDMRGYVQDASNLITSNAVGVFEVYHIIDFKRNAAAMLQFGSAAQMDTGASVIDTNRRIKDISPTALSGAQEAADTDYGDMYYATSLHLDYTKGFRQLFWVDKDSGNLTSQTISSTFDDTTYVGASDVFFAEQFPVTTSLVPSMLGAVGNDGETRSDLIIMANSSNAATARAVALFFPRQAPINKKQILGYTTAGNTLSYSEDRFVYHRFRGARGGLVGTKTVDGGPDGQVTFTNDLAVFGRASHYLGMIAPDNGNGVYERFRHQFFVLTGTPNAIKAAAQEIQDAL